MVGGSVVGGKKVGLAMRSGSSWVMAGFFGARARKRKGQSCRSRGRQGWTAIAKEVFRPACAFRVDRPPSDDV